MFPEYEYNKYYNKYINDKKVVNLAKKYTILQKILENVTKMR